MGIRRGTARLAAVLIGGALAASCTWAASGLAAVSRDTKSSAAVGAAGGGSDARWQAEAEPGIMAGPLAARKTSYLSGVYCTARSNCWAFGLDQKSWTSAPMTRVSKTTVAGLTPATTYYAYSSTSDRVRKTSTAQTTQRLGVRTIERVYLGPVELVRTFAIDGQTLGGTGLKAHLRIWGIQAPELRDTTRVENVPGMRARAFLADLLAKADHKVKCRPARFDRECRIVAQCSVGDGGDLGGSMIAGGMAYGFELDEALPWESRAGQRYADAEFEARKARRGLWPAWLGDQ